jgi:hypothetical protein
MTGAFWKVTKLVILRNRQESQKTETLRSAQDDKTTLAPYPNYLLQGETNSSSLATALQFSNRTVLGYRGIYQTISGDRGRDILPMAGANAAKESAMKV